MTFQLLPSHLATQDSCWRRLNLLIQQMEQQQQQQQH